METRTPQELKGSNILVWLFRQIKQYFFPVKTVDCVVTPENIVMQSSVVTPSTEKTRKFQKSKKKQIQRKKTKGWISRNKRYKEQRKQWLAKQPKENRNN